MKINQILVPLDLRESTPQLVKNVVKVASKLNSSVYFLVIMPDDAKIKSLESIIKERVEKSLAEYEELLATDDIKLAGSDIKYGKPVENVLEYAKSTEADLVYISPSFFKPKEGVELGVYTEKIIRRASVPVWVSRGAISAGISNLVCPVDFSDVSAKALEKAIVLAGLLDAELSIISVFEPLVRLSVFIEADLVSENQKGKDAYIKDAEDFLSNFNLESIKYSVRILEGEPDLEIVRYVEKNDIDLVLMGVTGMSSFAQALIGSVTQDVVRSIKCSFVTSKDVAVS